MMKHSPERECCHTWKYTYASLHRSAELKKMDLKRYERSNVHFWTPPALLNEFSLLDNKTSCVHLAKQIIPNTIALCLILLKLKPQWVD